MLVITASFNMKIASAFNILMKYFFWMIFSLKCQKGVIFNKHGYRDFQALLTIYLWKEISPEKPKDTFLAPMAFKLTVFESSPYMLLGY